MPTKTAFQHLTTAQANAMHAFAELDDLHTDHVASTHESGVSQPDICAACATFSSLVDAFKRLESYFAMTMEQHLGVTPQFSMFPRTAP